MALFQYSAKNTVITANLNPAAGIGKSHTFIGYGEDEFFSIELDDDDYTTVVGADGLVVRSFKPNPVATATLTLMHTSPSNAVLTHLRNMDKEIIGAGVFTLQLTVPPVATNAAVSGAITSILGAPFTSLTATAYVSKLANYQYSKEVGERAWTLTLVDCIFEKDIANIALNVANSTYNSVKQVGVLAGVL
jgi:hypothetical protein